MKQLFIIMMLLGILIIYACTPNKSDDSAQDGFTLVQGGSIMNQKSNLYGFKGTISDFYMAKYEVTQMEWFDIMGNNPSRFKGDSLPVESINWYNAIEFCNLRSTKEGLTPYYLINKEALDTVNFSEEDSVKWIVGMNGNANGYRLPTEMEWEYAASGGQLSKSYTYSGSDSIDEVAWCWQNSGDSLLGGFWRYSRVEANHCKTKTVGLKKPNELGIYDMSGNVYELCEDWYEDEDTGIGLYRLIRGGGWLGVEESCRTVFRNNFAANQTSDDVGLRLCRSN